VKIIEKKSEEEIKKRPMLDSEEAYLIGLGQMGKELSFDDILTLQLNRCFYFQSHREVNEFIASVDALRTAIEKDGKSVDLDDEYKQAHKSLWEKFKEKFKKANEIPDDHTRPIKKLEVNFDYHKQLFRLLLAVLERKGKLGPKTAEVEA
jgi:hypothetical protein